MPIVPGLCHTDVGGTTNATGAVVVGSAMVLGTNVGTVVFVPTTMLNATGVTDPIKTVVLRICLGRFFGRTSRKRHCEIA